MCESADFGFFAIFAHAFAAEVVKLVDTHVSGACVEQTCGFESHLRHQAVLSDGFFVGSVELNH